MAFPDFMHDDNLTAPQAAKMLIGCEIVRTFDDGRIARVRIVETEAYDQDDPASHTFHGKSERNRAMFEAGGVAYIYFTYGMHYCFNIVCGRAGYGSGVLIRAVEPREGAELIQERRPRARGVAMTNGPAKLTKALNIDKQLYLHNVQNDPLRLEYVALKINEKIAVTPRIGISQAVDELRRYVLVEENADDTSSQRQKNSVKYAVNPYVSEQKFTREHLIVCKSDSE